MAHHNKQRQRFTVRSIGVKFFSIVLLVLFANAFATWFITQEHYIYFWDWALYWMYYIDLSRSLVADPVIAMRNLFSSVRYSDYNLLPVLPLSPFAWIFGTGRLAYILAITNIALLPSAIIFGLVVRRLSSLPAHSRQFAPVLLASATILLLPAMWSPVLRGWPDVLGIVVIGSILMLAFSRPPEAQKLYHYLIIGLLLCVLVFVRRWYSFWAVTFFPAFILAHTMEICRKHDTRWQYFLTIARNTCLAGISFAFTLYAIAKPFLLRAIHTNYSDIYSAYRFANSYSDSLARLISHYGWIQLLVGIAGVAWLLANRETRIFGSFLIAQTPLIFLMFTHTQDFGIQHYYLLNPAIGIGIAVLAANAYLKITNRIWCAATLGFLFIALFAGFFTVFVPGSGSVFAMPGKLLPKVQVYPLKRKDIPEVNALLEYLESIEQYERGKIYVIASSSLLNSAILQSACNLNGPARTFCACISNTNDVDKRDGFPNQLLQATYLVLASPTQYHLRAEDQRVIGILADEIRKREGIGASYERLAETFELDEGVKVSIFKKMRPINDEALSALMAEFMMHYPDRQDLFSIKDGEYPMDTACQAPP